MFTRADPCPTETKIKSIPIYFFQSTIVNHQSQCVPHYMPVRPVSDIDVALCLAIVFLNAPFWGQNDAFKTQNDPFLKLFWYDYSLLAWLDPKGLPLFTLGHVLGTFPLT